jgi:hypothetical protein
VTIDLTSDTVAYFKAAATRHHMQCQKVFRQLPDDYVAHQKHAER